MTGERVAVIDIGSNSARLALLEVYADRAFKLVDELRETLRLGEQLDANGDLTAEAIERTLEISRVLARFCTAHRVTHVIGVATSALRRARNGPEVVDRIKAETGLRVNIISGDEEAYYDYVAAVNSAAAADRRGGRHRRRQRANRARPSTHRYPQDKPAAWRHHTHHRFSQSR